MKASLHAHTREWSGNPAVLGSCALRPVALRPRLSNGFALFGAWLGLRTVRFAAEFAARRSVPSQDRTVRKHGRWTSICLVVMAPQSRQWVAERRANT